VFSCRWVLSNQEMSDENKGFKVKDRRLFTPEGERRGAEADADTAPPPAPPEAPPGPRQAPPAPAEASAAQGPGPARVGDAPAGDPIGFASFLMSLAAQAGALLESPGANELEGARQIISILEMLADKTAGRRTPDEERVLESLLYELRLAYVERVRMARA
jgi:hypothetical protein